LLLSLFSSCFVEMDSQEQGNTSFIDLLNHNYNEPMGSSYPNVQMYEPEVEIGSNVKKPRRGNFSIEEDIQLIESWINTSTDPVHGNEQSKKTLE
jgi:hypothetical protein